MHNHLLVASIVRFLPLPCSVPACQSIVKKAIISKLLSAQPSRSIKQNADGWLQVLPLK